MIYAVLILGIVSQGLAFQCSETLDGPRICDKYNKAAASLVSAVTTVDTAIVDGIIQLSDQSATLYQSFLPTIGNINLNGKVIHLDNNTVITINGNMTQEEYQQLFKNLMSQLKILKLFGLDGVKELEGLIKTIQDVLSKALVPNVNAYNSLDVGESIEKAKAAIKEAIKNLSLIPRAIIWKVVERLDENVVKYMGVIDNLLNTFSFQSKVWETAKVAIRIALDALKQKISNDVVAKSSNAFSNAEADVIAFLDEMKTQKPIVRRSITDVWEKVKVAVVDLGSKIKNTTMEVVNQHKQAVIDSLNQTKTIVIDAVKQIIIEISGTVVKVITDGLTGTSA